MGERIKIEFNFEDSTKTTGKYLVFDTETTGLPLNYNAPPDDFKNWPYVVQIAWLLFDDEHKLIEHSNFYLKQPVVIPAEATNVHGITTAMMLEQGIEPSNAYANFKKALDNTEYLISHNIDFDVPTVQCDFLRNGMQWDFPNNKMFCTMKTGVNFCHIPLGTGKYYKWPTLAELYQKCFYPGYKMKNFPDATSTSNVHNANTDACMAAQCFFKLKEWGFFKEPGEDNFEDLHEIEEDCWNNDFTKRVTKITHLGLGTSCVIRDSEHMINDKVAAQFKKWDELWAKKCQKKSQTENSIAAEQMEDNFENLHDIVKSNEFNRNDTFLYVAEIKHRGLGTTRILKNESEWWLHKAVDAQFKEWDEKWAIICHKTTSQAAKEANLNIAEERTREAKEKQKQIDDLLIDALKSDFWDSLIETKEYTVQNPKNNLESMLSSIPKPTPPSFEELPEKPNGKSDWLHTMSLGKQTLYQVQLDLWKRDVDRINLFNSNLKDQYEKKLNEYGEEIQLVKKHYDKLEEDWEREKEKETHNNIQRQHNSEKLIEKYLTRNNEAIIEYCLEVLNNSQYPETFPKGFDLDYNSDSKILIVEYVLPAPDDLPMTTEVKYIAAKKELKKSFLSEKQLSKIYDSAIYKITLRTLHELFQADKAEALELIVFNGWVNSINKATGKKVSNCIVTIQARKEEFNEIELSNVEPKTCFKYLKGVGSSKLSSITAVQPIAQINKNENNCVIGDSH
jgi:restriction system protein